MSSDFKRRDAINFLSLVRQDLEKLRPTKEHESTVVSGRFSQVEVDTRTLEEFHEGTPAVLGRFEIIEQLGEGGFARVFLANDPNLDREVALKVPKPHVLLSSESRARFEREAKSAAILSHPNIVPVFECGSSGPIHFIASEFCPGPTLRQRISDHENGVNPRTAVEISLRLADALQHAHQRGIIHRDLKPANVILVDGDGDTASRLRITDFGLARQISDEDSLTANGAIVGTPAYMSPEQASGKCEVDHRSDIYSLGMILCEMLTGQTPFKRNSHAASIAAVINEQIPSIREANPKVDRDLEAICLKAVEKDPDKRYASAHEFASDLEKWLSGRAVSVRRLTTAEKAKRWLWRNPVLAAAIAVAMISLTAGLIVSTSQWNQAQKNLELAVEQKQRAERNASELHETIVKALELSVDSYEKNLSVSPAQEKVLDELIQAHKRLIDEEAEVRISEETFECYERLSRIYRVTGQYAESIAIYNQARKMVDRCFLTEEGRKEFGLCAAEVELQRAVLHEEMENSKVRGEAYLKSIELLTEAEPHSDRKNWLETGFRIYRNWGFYHHGRRDMDMCQKALELAARYADEALLLSPHDEHAKYNAAMGLCDMSHVYTLSWEKRLEMLEAAEQRFEDILKNPETEIDCRYRLCYIRNEIGFYLRAEVQDYERAEQYIQKCMQGLRELVDEFPNQLDYTTRLSHAYMRLIDIYMDQNDYDRVLAVLPLSREAHERSVPSTVDERIAHSLILEGKIWADEKDQLKVAHSKFDEAIAQIESSEYFALDRRHIVDNLLEARRQKVMLYSREGDRHELIQSAGDGYRLAVQRALEFPSPRNCNTAVHRGVFYARKIAEVGKFGQAKAVLDTLAEACPELKTANYKIAQHWAMIDHLQRDAGKEKHVWEASRKRSLQLLAKAIELGFSDFKQIRDDKYFREYRHLPEFEAICDKIRPE